MPRLSVVRYERTTDKPGVFRGGIGWEEMRAGDVTYIVVNDDTGLAFKHCTREPNGVWVDDQTVENWVEPEQTAVPYDWFENMQ